MTAVTRFRSPIGTLTVEATERGVCGIALGRGTAPRPPVSAASREHLAAAIDALAAYFRGEPAALPALDLHGSRFDEEVWRALTAIPFGETRTYGELASAIGAPGAARAVGAANGRNPVAILVPCHRVVAANGRLGGYSAGIARKRWLLAHESGHVAALRPPR